MVEQSRGAEEDGRADGEEGEPAASPGDEEEEQEKQEEHSTHRHFPMSYKPGRQDLCTTDKNHQRLIICTKQFLKNHRLLVALWSFALLPPVCHHSANSRSNF